jgi:hypothetical protein
VYGFCRSEKLLIVREYMQGINFSEYIENIKNVKPTNQIKIELCTSIFKGIKVGILISSLHAH